MSDHRYNCETINRPSRRNAPIQQIGERLRNTDKPINLDFFAVRATKLA